MLIGDRLRPLLESRKLSQGDIEQRTGSLRCYVSRLENGHTVPAVGILEKFARAMEMLIYQLLFYDCEEPPAPPGPKRISGGEIMWGDSWKDARTLEKLRQLLGQATESDRRLLFYMAHKMCLLTEWTSL